MPYTGTSNDNLHWDVCFPAGEAVQGGGGTLRFWRQTDLSLNFSSHLLAEWLWASHLIVSLSIRMRVKWQNLKLKKSQTVAVFIIFINKVPGNDEDWKMLHDSCRITFRTHGSIKIIEAEIAIQSGNMWHVSHHPPVHSLGKHEELISLSYLAANGFLVLPHTAQDSNFQLMRMGMGANLFDVPNPVPPAYAEDKSRRLSRLSTSHGSPI